MSECVVRMKTPSSCYVCPMRIACVLYKKWLANEADMPCVYDDGCLIICALPEGHGRLVDIDEEILNVKQIAGWSGVTNCWRGPIANLINKDTMKYIHILIPATEGGKE